MSEKNLPASGRNYLTQAVFAGGEVVADRYRIKRFIGKGGMGEVYLAEHLFTGQESALKVLPLRRLADQRMRRRMQREAAAGTKVVHPNLVQVRDGGITADNVIYIVMEYVGEHRTLRDYLNAFGPLAPVHWIAYAIQIADGLAACHAAEVWHRDIKPENLLVLPGARLKIIDLGLARVRTEALRTTGVGEDADGKKRTFATPLYASPEQLFPQGFEITEKTDIWSLGTVIYEMASGRHLWQQVTNEFPNATQASFAIATRTPPSLGDVVRSIPPDLAALIARCHRKDPSERPSALELSTELAHWLQWARREPEPGMLRRPEAITDPLSVQPLAPAQPAALPAAAPTAPAAAPGAARAAAPVRVPVVEPSPLVASAVRAVDGMPRRPATIGVADTETRVLVDFQPGELPESSQPQRLSVPAQDTIDDRAGTELYMKRIEALHAPSAHAPRGAPAPGPRSLEPSGPVVDTDVTQATTGHNPVPPRRSRSALLGAAISLALVLVGSLIIVLRARPETSPTPASAQPAQPPSSAQSGHIADASNTPHEPTQELAASAAAATAAPSSPSPATPSPAAPPPGTPAASLVLPTPSPTMRGVSASASPQKPGAPPPTAKPSNTVEFFVRDWTLDPPPPPSARAPAQPPWFIVQPDEAP